MTATMAQWDEPMARWLLTTIRSQAASAWRQAQAVPRDHYEDACWQGAFTAIESYDGTKGMSLQSWIGLKITYALRSVWRSPAMQAPRLQAQQRPGGCPSPLTPSDRRLYCQQLWPHLTHTQRQAMALCWSGYTPAEIAETLRMKRSTVYTVCEDIRATVQRYA
jgi:DNA-directed RNA polymerase specialized sigma24 family protein